MPLNYNKWDNLQLSDDSDIEVHPNVDKKSMIRWKQRDIHEKRHQAKQKLSSFPLETALNTSLLSRIDTILSNLRNEGQSYLAREILRLKGGLGYVYEEKRFEEVEKEGEGPSEDHIMVSLLMQVVAGVGKKEQEAGKPPGGDKSEALVKELEWHRQRLVDRQEEIKKETKEIERDQAKYITSEDLKMGWDSKTIVSSTPTAQPQSAPPTSSSASAKSKQKKTETVVETLNSPAVDAAAAQQAASDSEEEEEDLPTLTPSAHRFSLLPPLSWPSLFSAISSDPTLLTEETSDALMVEAFNQGMKQTTQGKERAKNCVEKALVGQYCRSLGRDGVRLFFQRMAGENPAALKLFLDDVDRTSTRLLDRAAVLASERTASKSASSTNEPEGVEQIQLVATDPSISISFEIPDGPPPETLQITGEGSEELDPVLVKEFLQKRWEIFEAFPKGLKKALKEKSLEKVNKVLGRMEVGEAEEVVEKLQEAGILSFESSGVIDQTGRSPDTATTEGGTANETVPIPVPASSSSSTPEKKALEEKIGEVELADELD